MNLWLIPASDAASTANIPKTLSVPIAIERADRAGIPANGHAWGARASSEMNINKFNKMAPGDWCLFYTQAGNSAEKKYHWKAQIDKTTRSRDISNVLWDTPTSSWCISCKTFERSQSRLNSWALRLLNLDRTTSGTRRRASWRLIQMW